MKRIVTMQDVSCVGKCSLTVALPVISAMGVECGVIPTAVLSTHTMFRGFTFHDLTGEIRPILDHWKREKIDFDGIYTGYLGSFEQLELAKALFREFGEGKLVAVDPCMADNGKLYPGFTPEFADEMRHVCALADVICPNLTEAAFLLREPYREEYDEEYVRATLRKLCELGCKKAVLTGISLEKGKLGAYALDSETGEYFQTYQTEQPAKFHGTGDLWASTFFAAMVRGKSFPEALDIACAFTTEAVRLTLADPEHVDYGVNFEEAIPFLLGRL